MKQSDRIYKLGEIDSNIPKGMFVVSFSQFSKWKKCPRAWKLAYIDKQKISKPGINATFGTAMHRCIQKWVSVMLTETVKASEEIIFENDLLATLREEYLKDVQKYGSHFSTREELAEFYSDGVSILNWLRKNRTRYFSTKTTQFVGCEIPVLHRVDPKKPVLLMCFLDLVTRDLSSKKFLIQDLKTSTRGWSKWDKGDEVKISQLRLYKKYFSEQYGIPIDDIEIEYLILKRKIDENSEFPQRRVQQFQPASGKVSINKTVREFTEFLDFCFSETGYNTEAHYHAIAGSKFSNCRFCEYNSEEYCPVKDRICV